MGMKIGLALGLGVGYVLGTRAGRERYEKIKAAAHKLREQPFASRPLDNAGQRVSEAVRTGGERVTDKVADAVKERLFGTPTSTYEYVDVEVEEE
ncbi:MAG: YtxH domain-containing protein [Actinomyces sp.]|nr:YtxH domain-containing protein [Actinomyces sp.]